MKKIYVYLAGPYSDPDPVENTSNIISIADSLRKHGFIPYVPHLNLLWHIVHPHPPEFWYAYDLVWLEKCDELLRLPGKSIGADVECVFAEEHGIRVLHGLEEFVAYHIDQGDIRLEVEGLELVAIEPKAP